MILSDTFITTLRYVGRLSSWGINKQNCFVPKGCRKSVKLQIKRNQTQQQTMCEEQKKASVMNIQQLGVYVSCYMQCAGLYCAEMDDMQAYM